MLSVYIDNSGSMGEMDKIEVAKYIARSLKNATFYLLNGRQMDLDSITLDNDKQINIKAGGMKILLSDGLFNSDEKLFDIALAIGLDADIKALEKVSNKVYKIDDIAAFLESISLLVSTKDKDLIGNSTWE